MRLGIVLLSQAACEMSELFEVGGRKITITMSKRKEGCGEKNMRVGNREREREREELEDKTISLQD